MNVEEGETFIRLRAVLSGENSELLEKLVADNFDQSSSAFIDALCDCLPYLSGTDVCWRFHFLLGAVYYTAAGPHRIHAFSNGRCDPGNTEDVIEELVPFMTQAFQAPPSKPERQPRRLVVGAAKGIRDANRERRQIVQKKRVKMVCVEYDHDVRCRPNEFRPHGGEELSGFGTRALAFDKLREHWRMRHAERAYEFRH